MRVATAVVLLGALAGPGRAQEATELHWLAGCWVARSGDTRVEELWTEPAGGLLVGLSRSVRPGRPASFEFLRIESSEDGLVYRASPGGRPATSFPVVTLGPDGFRVENPEHDFPRAIAYGRIGADSLLARVYGESDPGAEPTFVLRYARSACPGTPDPVSGA